MANKISKVAPVMPAQQAAIYVRISSDREGTELGVERQEDDGRGLAERLGLPVYRVYKDNDISASTRSRKDRPDYTQMLKDARAGFFCTIIAYTSGRLTRRPREHEDQIELAEQCGITFSFIRSPSFDLNTANGRMIARVLAAKDAAEAEEISERVARAKLQRAEQGQYLGGYRAYCYEGPQYDEDGNVTNKGRINIAIIQHEAETYREIVQRIVAGERIATIVRDLNKRDVSSPDGKQWNYGNTKRIITKQRYVIFDDADPDKRGTLEHRGQTYRATWPGLISRATYELMMARLRAVSQDWEHGLSRGRAYLLSNIVVCGGTFDDGQPCGRPMYGAGRKLGNTYQPRYRCRSTDNSGNVLGCGKTFRGADPVEDFVTEAVLERLDTPDIARALAIRADDDGREEELQSKLVAQRSHRKQLLIDHGKGLYSQEDFQVILDAADDEIALILSELAKLHADDPANILPTDRPLREVWESATLDWRRSVVLLVVEKVILKPGFKPGTMMYKQWRFNPAGVEIVWRKLPKAEVVANLCLLLQALKKPELALAA